VKEFSERLIEDQGLVVRAKEMTEGMVEIMTSNPDYLANWGLMAINIVTPAVEIAVTGPDLLSNAQKILSHFSVNTVLAGSNNDSDLVLLKNRISEKNNIYVCEDGACHLPVQEADEALEQLKAIRDL
jgi:hypothetical protein